MPSPAELKTVDDDSCSTLEEEEDAMRLYVCVRVIYCVFKISYRKTSHVHIIIRQQSESSGSFMSEPQPVHPTYI
jgi:hypothetical protein